jgi:hypothetical protein
MCAVPDLLVLILEKYTFSLSNNAFGRHSFCALKMLLCVQNRRTLFFSKMSRNPNWIVFWHNLSEIFFDIIKANVTEILSCSFVLIATQHARTTCKGIFPNCDAHLVSNKPVLDESRIELGHPLQPPGRKGGGIDGSGTELNYRSTKISDHQIMGPGFGSAVRLSKSGQMRGSRF